MFTADTITPISPPALSHWLAILATCPEHVRCWVKQLCKVEGPAFTRGLIEHLASVSIPTARGSLVFQFHRARGNARAKDGAK